MRLESLRIDDLADVANLATDSSLQAQADLVSLETSARDATMMRQREGSEAGSDILVGPPAGQQPRAEVKNGRHLIIRLGKEKLSSALVSYQSDDEDDFGVNASDDYDDFAGRNARGTFSKAYTLRHPDIEWVHRGQGRYLPAGEIKRSLPSGPVKRSRYVATAFRLRNL